MKLRLNLECPYCNRAHTHLVDVGTVAIEKELPSDPETQDLEEFREGEDESQEKEGE